MIIPISTLYLGGMKKSNPTTSRSEPLARDQFRDEPDDWDASLIDQLESVLLPRYMPGCRWFGHKGGTVREVKVAHVLPIGDAREARLLIVRVIPGTGPTEHYALVLAVAADVAAAQLRTESPLAIIAILDANRLLYDGLHSPRVRAELLKMFATEPRDDLDIACHSELARSIHPADLSSLGSVSRLLGADHSNTAIIYGDRWFLKFYRKFEWGAHPDATLTRVLSEDQQLSFVPRFAGLLTLAEAGRTGALGLLVDVIHHQGDGWTYVLAELAQYFERVDRARAELTEASVRSLIGQDFVRQVGHLGRRTAQMHQALATAPGRPDFAPVPFTEADQAALLEAVEQSGIAVTLQLQGAVALLPPELRHDVTRFLEEKNRLLPLCDRFQKSTASGQKIRVHGDYHLGQVLKTANDLVILDFEGEPRRGLEDRIQRRTPLHDVAGMLRSFNYAACAALAAREVERARFESWADAWVREVSSTFLAGYLDVARGASFLPTKPADGRLLLEVLLLEKVIYEIGYELNYRPDFLPIPLRAICQLMDEPTSVLRSWI